MKLTGNFSTDAKLYALKKQMWYSTIFWIIFILIILAINEFCRRKMSIDLFYPSLGFLGAAIIFGEKLFYSPSVLVKRKLEYLKNYLDRNKYLEQYKDFQDKEWKDDSDRKSAEEYKELMGAINEVENEQLRLTFLR